MGLIGSALSGLNAAQAAITVVSHNTANINTPGYTRQELVQTTNTGQYTGAGYVGNGAKVTAIRRVYDEFLTELNWPLGATIAILLLVTNVIIMMAYNRVVERSYRRSLG